MPQEKQPLVISKPDFQYYDQFKYIPVFVGKCFSQGSDGGLSETKMPFLLFFSFFNISDLTKQNFKL